ncbi:MAG: transcriptional regulator, partial [Alphaproteobacteria bacterium]
MKIAHHPDTATLASYAAGSLDETFATVVATHLASCVECRARLREIEEVGGTMLETIDAIGLNEGAVERVMSRLDEQPEEVAAEPKPAETSLPRPLARLVNAPLDDVAWKSVVPGVA